mgnify:CR=1 FL=1
MLLTSNFKSRSGGAWSVELGKKNLIVGPNGSGKTAIVQSFEAATSATVDDVVGRSEVSGAAMLLEFGVGGTARAELCGDGVVAVYEVYAGDDGKVHGPEHTVSGKKFEYPLRRVRDILSGSPDRARRAVLAASSGVLSEADVLVTLPSHLHDDYRAVATLNPKASAVEVMSLLRDRAGTEKLAFAAEARGAEKIVETLAARLGESRPTDAAIASAEAAIVHAKERAGDSLRRCASEVLDELENARKEAAITEHLVGQRGPVSPSALSGVVELLDYAIGEGDLCPACGTSVGSDRLSLCRAHYATLAEAEAMNSGSVDAEQSLKYWMRRIRELEELYVVSPEVAPEPVDVSSLVSAHASLIRTRAEWDQTTSSRDRAFSLARKATKARELEQATKAAVKSLTAACADAFAARVNEFMPDGWVFGINAVGETRDSFRVGIARHGRLDSVLSGAEWASVQVAMAMALSDYAATNVIVVEDRAWDASTLRKALRAWTAFDGYVFLCTPSGLPGRPLPGWTVIDATSVGQ